ncbi:MAG TPA: sorbosone dehydrogenase family protein [Thermoanaerobaculia bacterium]|nr:sorbosone dehydrogenase family protein [Thermoanaerobaculia bacterium]
MKHALAAVSLVLLLACSRSDAQSSASSSSPAAKAAPPQSTRTMQHYEVRADRLPKPFHTSSAGNPPRVISRPANASLQVPPGFRVELWATDISNPRNMVLAPNGDVFLADTSSDTVWVFRDTNGDSRPDQRFTWSDDLRGVFGLAFRGNHLYVGNEDAIVRFDYKSGQTEASGKPVKLTSLPAGGHSTRNVIFNRDGSKMYVAVGSGSNVSDETSEPLRAAITEYNPDGSGRRTFASGLRNPIGLAWNPADQSLWTVVNERDGLGDDLVPDYATEVKRDAFYGWPFSYIGKNVDPRREGERNDLVAKAIVPSVLIQAHSAPITVVFYTGSTFPQQYRGGAFVALHGSWNRANRTGYKVVFIPFRNGKPTGGYDDFLTGWAPDPKDRTVWGRPAGLLVLRDGSLLVSDDGAGVVWRVSYGK